MEWNTTSEKFDARRAAERTRFGVAALSLSGTVLGRRASLGYVYGVEHKIITLALRGCMVLTSVNAVLRLLKRSTCVRGRTHLV